MTETPTAIPDSPERPGGTIATDHIFSVDEQTVLRELAGLVVTASAEYDLPGADDELIFNDILASARDVEDGVRAALLRVADCAVELAQATSELEGQPEMAPFVSLVLQCYYRDDRVMRSLDMEPRPPFPLGYAVPEGDWSMLAAVQARGKIWREV